MQQPAPTLDEAISRTSCQKKFLLKGVSLILCQTNVKKREYLLKKLTSIVRTFNDMSGKPFDYQDERQSPLVHNLRQSIS